MTQPDKLWKDSEGNWHLVWFDKSTDIKDELTCGEDALEVLEMLVGHKVVLTKKAHRKANQSKMRIS